MQLKRQNLDASMKLLKLFQPYTLLRLLGVRTVNIAQNIMIQMGMFPIGYAKIGIAERMRTAFVMKQKGNKMAKYIDTNDLIRRQDAIDAMTDANIVENMDSVIDTELHRVKRAVHRIIAGLPSAEPKKGEWIPANNVGDCCYKCSICGYVYDAYSLRADNFCQSCGADMRGK